MIQCGNCQEYNLPGALFCGECGARLTTSGNSKTQTLQKTPADLLIPEMPKNQFDEEKTFPVKDVVITLLLVENGQVLHLAGRSEYTIGRTSEGQPILPDIDLSPYGAFSQGVSRLHLSIKIQKSGVFVTDLGSSNGTRVNSQKIVPNVDYPINHGDTIVLGKIKLQILIHR